MGSIEEGKLAPAWLEFEKEIGFRPNLQAPLPNMLKQWEVLGGALVEKLTFPAPDTSVKTEDKDIGNGLIVRIYTPPNRPSHKLPAGVFFHGGGWAMGDLDGDDALCRTISKNTSTVLVSVAYRLAPQHPYPAALDDCVTAFNWTTRNATSLNSSPDSGFLLGASAGANLAIGTALRVIDAGDGAKVTGLVALMPVTIHPDVVPEGLKGRYTSYKEHTNNTVDSESAMRAFFDAYAAPKDDIYTSPLLHPKLAQLPRTYLSWCEIDTLRDDGRLFGEALESAGVPTKSDEFKGFPHYFFSFPSVHLKAAAEDCIEKSLEGVKFVLGVKA